MSLLKILERYIDKDDKIFLTPDQARNICMRLELDKSHYKCGAGYYSLKRQLENLKD